MEPVNPQSKTILVINEDKLICDLFEMWLSQQGFNVETSVGPQAANLVRTEERQYDLVILERMADEQGHAAVKELQDRLGESAILFVVEDALDSGSLEEIQEEPNVKEVWQKPINMKSMNTKIHEILGTAPKAPNFGN